MIMLKRILDDVSLLHFVELKLCQYLPQKVFIQTTIKNYIFIHYIYIILYYTTVQFFFHYICVNLKINQTILS